MELRKHQRYIGNEATPFSDSSSTSDDDESAFKAMEEDVDNLPKRQSVSLEAEVSGSNEDVVILEL